MGRKLEGACAHLGVGPHLTQYGLGPGLPLYRTKWHIGPSSRLAYPSSRLATIDMGRKSGDCALFIGGVGYPFNTVWPGPIPTSVPSGILIQQAV